MTKPEGERPPPLEIDIEDHLALVAHELRSPLTVALGAARMLERHQELIPDQLRGLVGSIIQACKRQDRIINDALTLAQLGTGGIELYREDLDINKLISSYLGNIQYLTNRHQTRFEPAPNPLIVNIDPIRIEQVLDKLVGNAIKYSPMGGLIELQTVEQTTHVQVCIKDEGVGIVRDNLSPALFERRRRFKNDAEASGLGFGLYVARAIVKAHGGEIWAESEGENKGSTFHFTLPYTQDTSNLPQLGPPR